ncbi:MAG: M20/M25/M40 family metallo-hydrolase [Fimbriiglobus sp.]|nr:M20/M25/M40 family metallo-hydrolase [Fimbriiglobus sp.]
MPRTVLTRTLAGIALGLVAPLLWAENPTAKNEKPTTEVASAVDPVALDKKILAEAKERTQVMKNLQHLCDVIGPRVTGSPNLEKANRWAEAKMTEYGLTNVKLEPWEIPVAWERGTATLTLLEPQAKSLTVASAAWGASTKGKITGEVVYLDAKTKDDLAKYKGKLKNALVITRPPSSVLPLSDIGSYLQGRPRPATPPMPEPKKDEPKKEEAKKDEPKKDEPKPEQPRPMGGGPSMMEMMALQRALGEFLQAEGAAATLRDSAKPHGLLTMTGSWPSEGRGGQQNPLPSLFITHEHYSMLYRLASAKDGPRPKVELEVSNKFIPGPVTVYNTVGEITGSEKPDEFVVVGAHLDSWDLGTGATDNGTGSCIVLEVARVLGALAKAGIRPKRTIRFVLFTGEEQGLHGSKQYVKRHEAEMPKTSAALVHDTGTGFVKGFGLQGREAVKKILDPELETLKTVSGWSGLTLRGIGGTDHLSFDSAKVPGFACDQDPDEYYLTHHTQSDTLEHAKEPNLIQGAQVIAVTAMRIANLPDLLPRERPATPSRGGRTEEPKPADPKKEEKKDDKPGEQKKADDKTEPKKEKKDDKN